MPSIECRRQRIRAWDRHFRFPGSARCTSRAVRLTPRPVPRNWPEEDVPPARTPSSRIVNAPHDLSRATSDAGEQIGIIHERHPNRIPVNRSRRVVSCRVIRNADPPTSRVPRAHRPTARTQRGVEARPESPPEAPSHCRSLVRRCRGHASRCMTWGPPSPRAPQDSRGRNFRSRSFSMTSRSISTIWFSRYWPPGTWRSTRRPL